MLWSVAEDQQIDINRHRDSLHKIWHVAPTKPREGMLVYADGTDWNPGSGAGYYVYYAGAWHAMSGGGGGGGGISVVQDEGVALPVQSTLNFVGAGVTATNDAGGSRTLITIPGGGGGSVVTSVFTRIGDVIAASGDYTAAQVTNAVSILGSYANPAWITSLAYSKLTGVPTSFTPSAHVHAAADTTSGIFAVARLGSGTPSSSNWLRGDGAWTALPASAVTSVFTRTGAVIAASGDYTAAQVTNAVSVLGSYADPAWITSLAYSKITGAPTIASIQTPWLQNISAAGFQLNNAGRIGIATSVPQSPLQVLGNTAAVPAAGTYGGAIFSNNAVEYGLYVGSTSTGAGYIQTQRGDSATTYPLLLNPNGNNVGIGVTPSYQLHLSTDSAAKLTTSTWSIISDARIKKNVEDLQGGLEVIGKLRPISAEFNGLGGTPEGERIVGFLAQELQEILPYTVGSKPGKLREEDLEDTQLLDVNLHECLMHAILAIKQLKAKVEALELAAATP